MSTWTNNVRVNEIIPISNDQYILILDFPPIDILYSLIDENYKYVWICEHLEVGCEWKPIEQFQVFGQKVNTALFRNLRNDILLETSEFLKLIPFYEDGILLRIVQTNTIPPYFMNPANENISQETWCGLLNKHLDYLFELNYCNDYSPIISPNKAFLERVLKTQREISSEE